MLVLFNIAAAGCLSEETSKTPKLDISFVGTTHKIYAGDTTTFVVVIDNNRDENDTVALSVASSPSGWEVTLNQTEFNITAESSYGVFVVIKSKDNAKTGEYKIKILAKSQTFDSKKSVVLKTKVISDSGETVIVGDKVEVDYLGYLETYKVFDSSLEKIANEKGLQKTNDFTRRGSYDPLRVYVGPDDPDLKDDYINTVQGFWEAIVGMRKGQSRTVVIHPEKGYGNFINTTLNITEETTLIETMTIEEFETNYPNEKLHLDLPFEHHFWGWNSSIFYYNMTEDVVKITNEPYLDQVIIPYGWKSRVSYRNHSDNGGEGRIVVTHMPQDGDEGEYLGYPAEVLSVGSDTIEIKFNDSPHNLANEILIFDITLVDIKG
jgi:FKBP-type peptidyl-prolyl cis-trans isomerase